MEKDTPSKDWPEGGWWSYTNTSQDKCKPRCICKYTGQFVKIKR